jgi:hypothetical protein
MTAVLREVKEGQQVQGIDEKIAYEITTTPWGISPTNVSVVVKDTSNNNADVTSDVTSGTTTVVGDVITLLFIESLTESRIYRVEVKFTSGSNIFEAYFTIKAEL